MLDSTDSPLTPATPVTPATPLPRPRPTRTDAAIEAPADGPETSAGHEPANGASPGGTEASPVLPRRPFVLDTRPDWTLAVRHEAARHVRYGRPVSVLLLELTGDADGPALDSIARDVADLIRTQARATDRAVRLAPGSFRILMPETGERPARAAADRLERAYEAVALDRPNEALRIEVATPSQARSLEDALAEAEGRLGAPGSRAGAPGGQAPSG